MGYVQQYTDVLCRKKQKYVMIDSQLFVKKDQWVVPVGPLSQAYYLNKTQCRELIGSLGGLWVMWTDGFGVQASSSEWHAVICRKHRAVEDVPSGNTRSKLRRGLKQCEVRQVEVKEIALYGYETYCEAVINYKNFKNELPSSKEFFYRVMSDEPFWETRHRWAAYYGGKMIAFAQNLIYDKTEVDYNLIKLHPAYLNRYSAYALFYKMNEFYLGEQHFEYTSDGTCSISHDTGIQDFLIKEFGFEKAYTGLHVHYRPPLGQLIKLVRPFRRMLTGVYPKANALFELDRLRCQ